MQTGLVARGAFLAVSSLTLPACGGGGGGTVSTPTPTPIATTAFTTWRTALANKAIEADGLGKQVTGTWDGTKITPAGNSDNPVTAVFMFDANAQLSTLTINSSDSFAGGQISRMSGDASLPDLAANSGFVAAESPTSRAVVSDPKSVEWDYQSFGIWETGLGTTTRNFGAMSVGAPTTTSILNMPSLDGAIFTGKLVGSYVDPNGAGHTAFANLTVGVDLTNQSLSFATTNTYITTDWVTFADASNHLNLTGTLNLAADGTSFTTNTLQTADGQLAGGTSSGQFYGPNAEELGGTFFLNSTSSVETYSGAYGAKR